MTELEKYPCPHCPSVYASCGNRSRHMRIYHPDKPSIRKLNALQLIQAETTTMTTSPPQHLGTVNDQVAKLLAKAVASNQSDDASALRPSKMRKVRGVSIAGSGEWNLCPDAINAFSDWLGEPPLTLTEKRVKMWLGAKGVGVTAQQRLAVRSTLQFVFCVLVINDICSRDDLKTLTILSHLDTCQKLHAALEARCKGLSRIHVVFLLLKRVIVYLSATESLRLQKWVAPEEMPAFDYVESVYCASKFTTDTVQGHDEDNDESDCTITGTNGKGKGKGNGAVALVS